jgi:hypothetical protein
MVKTLAKPMHYHRSLNCRASGLLEQNVGPKPPTVRFEMEAVLAGARSTWALWISRSRRIRWKPTRPELAVIAVVGIGLAILLWPIIKHGPAGPNVPPFENDESRRLHNDMGLSIIVPQRWTCLQNSPLGIHLYPMTPFASRSRATMSLARLGEEPDLSRFTKVRFRDCDAWEEMHIARAYSFDDGALSVFRLYIQHPIGWIEFTYSIASETESLPASIREYIQSIEIDDAKVENP